MTSLTPQALFDFADQFARRKESTGKGTNYPTFRQAAKRFGVTLDEVEQACLDWQGDGYMQPAVGMGGQHGCFKFENKGDWLVEAYH